MTKRIFSLIGLTALMVLMTGALSAATPMPTFTLVQGLPSVMNVGESYTVVVQVESNQAFTSVQAMPDFYYPGRGVVAVQGSNNRATQGTSATLTLEFKAKGSTTGMANGVAPVSVVVGVRYGGGVVVSQRYDFYVQVP